MSLPRSRRLAASGLGSPRRVAVVVALAIVATLAPLALDVRAAAADDALTHLNMGCTIDNASDHQESDHSGGPLSHETPSNAVAVDAARQSIHVFSQATFGGDTTERSGEDCGADGDFRYHLAVGAGASGLTDGDPVTLTATVVLDGYFDESFDSGDVDFYTNANVSVGYSLHHPSSGEDCGLEACPATASEGITGGAELDAFAERTIWADGPDGSLETTADRYWYQLSSNLDSGIDEFSDTAGVVCETWPAGCAVDPAPFRFPQEAASIEFETTVGSVLDASGQLDAFTQAFTSQVSAVADFTLNVEVAPAPGYEGLEVEFVAAGETGPDPDDPQPPGAPTVSLPAVVNIANQHAVVVSGTGDPATTATIRVDDTDPATAPVTTTALLNSSGYTVTLDLSGLTDGTLTVAVALTDDLGTTGPEATVAPHKDTVAPAAPTVTITDPINGSNVTAVTAAGRGESGATAVIAVDDTRPETAPVIAEAAIGTAGYSATMDVSRLADGPITATVVVDDPAGNRSPVATATATKSVPPPAWLQVVRRAITSLIYLPWIGPLEEIVSHLLQPVLLALRDAAADMQAVVCDFVDTASQALTTVFQNGNWWEQIIAGIALAIMRSIGNLARC